MWQTPNNLEDQLFEGLYDTDDCWDFSGTSLTEVVLKSLFPTMSQVAQQFFISNNYCDAQGNFALSRRYIAVLSQKKNNGNDQLDFWDNPSYGVQNVGMIPRSMLDFTPISSQDPNYQAFVADFFNPASVTQAMKDFGQQFLTYFSVSAKNVAPDTITNYINQTPVQIGIPIPRNGAWNNAVVNWDGSQLVAQHAVVFMGGTFTGNYLNGTPLYNCTILDSYLTALKQLVNYPIMIATVPTITINTSGTIVTVSYVVQLINLLKSWGAWTVGKIMGKKSPL